MAVSIRSIIGVLNFLSTFFLLGWSCMLLMVYLLFTQYYYVPLLYFAWYMYDKETPNREGRRMKSAPDWRIFRWMSEYFDAELHRTEPLDPNKNYLFCHHPHGIFVFSGFINFATNATGFDRLFPNFRRHFLVLDGHFMLPIYRDYFLISGAGCINAESINYKATQCGKGNIIWIAPGGAAEALAATVDSNDINLLLNRRRGFIREALRAGLSVVPSFTFGENDTYQQVVPTPGSWFESFQTVFRRITGLAAPLASGSFLVFPRHVKLDTVVGKPIDFPTILHPSKADIEKHHAMYCDALLALYNKNKKKFGHQDRKLNLG